MVVPTRGVEDTPAHQDEICFVGLMGKQVRSEQYAAAVWPSRHLDTAVVSIPGSDQANVDFFLHDVDPRPITGNLRVSSQISGLLTLEAPIGSVANFPGGVLRGITIELTYELVPRPILDSAVILPTSGTAPARITITCAGHVPDSPSPIDYYEIDFGDDSALVQTARSGHLVSGAFVLDPASSAVAQHVYAAGGSYVVKVTAVSREGLRSIEKVLIYKVSDLTIKPPLPALLPPPNGSGIPTSATFNPAPVT